jgi:hypothetical protein
MGAKKAAAARDVSEQELEGVVRALIERASGLSRTEFKKELGAEYKALEKRALEMARALAGRRVVHRWASGRSKERFFATEPLDTLSKAVATVLADGPLESTELERRVENEGRGLRDLLKEWLKHAPARGELFAHPKAAGGTKKRFGLRPPEPDPNVVLKSVFTALDKALTSKDGSRLSKEAVLSTLAAKLGLPSPAPATAPSPPPATERESFIRALRELSAQNVQDGLLPIRDLRARLRLEKEHFDRLSLELLREGVVTLHHHDFPTSLSPAERAELVRDERGTHYVGIALRRSHG